MDVVVEVAVHLGLISGVAFDSIDAHTPVLSLIAGRVALGFEDISVFAEQMAPFTEANADVQYRGRFELAKEVNDRRNRVGAAARHGDQGFNRNATRRSFLKTQGSAVRYCRNPA